MFIKLYISYVGPNVVSCTNCYLTVNKGTLYVNVIKLLRQVNDN